MRLDNEYASEDRHSEGCSTTFNFQTTGTHRLLYPAHECDKLIELDASALTEVKSMEKNNKQQEGAEFHSNCARMP